MCFQEALAKLHLSLAALGLPVERLLPSECRRPQAVEVSDLGRKGQPEGPATNDNELAFAWPLNARHLTLGVEFGPHTTALSARHCNPAQEPCAGTHGQGARAGISALGCPIPEARPPPLEELIPCRGQFQNIRNLTGERVAPSSGKIILGSKIMFRSRINGLSTSDEVFSFSLL